MKFIFILCFSFPGLLAVAQDEQDSLRNIERPDSTYLLPEFVISANKIPEMRSKVGQQVHVIPSAKIQELNVQTTADLIANSGVVTMQKSQQGGGSPQLRGFEASRVVLVIDGVRMNNLIYRAGHLQNIITLDNNTLERAEILLGPSSTVYGSDALGGVIHLRTKDVLLSEDDGPLIKGGAFVRYGTVNDEKTGHFDINIGGKKFGSFSSFTYSDFGDLRMGKKENPALGEPFGLRPFYAGRSAGNMDILIKNDDRHLQKFSGYSQYDILQKFLLSAGNIRHLMNFQFSNSSDVPRYDRLTDPDGAGLRNAEWYYGPQERLLASYQVSVQEPGRMADSFSAMLSYQDIRESRHDRRFNNQLRRNQTEEVDVWGLTIDLNKVSGDHNFRYGFDGQFNQVASSAFNLNVNTGERSDAATRYPNGGNTMNFAALYFTHTFDISRKLTLNDGVRLGSSRLHASFEEKSFFPFPFDEVEQKNRYASGNLGLIYRPGLWRLALVTSTGYRVPNIDDLAKVFDTNAGQSLIVPNPGIKPEKTLNWDASIGKHFGDKVNWENTFYYTWFYDAIILDRFSFNGQSEIMYDGRSTQIMANQNKRRAYITGFSSVLRAEISRALTMDGSYNYTYGRIRTDSADSPLDHIPPPFGRVSVRYHTGKYKAEIFSNFNGWKRLEDYFLNGEDNEAYATPEGMPSWYTINVRFAWTVTKAFAIQAGADNILDLQYRTFASGINAPGRNFFITLRGSF